jgi:tryptophan halogenase
MKILVVGGGTAGLISAIILKKRLDYQVDVVYSKNIGIVGVGEGSTEHFNEFMKFAGIDFHTVIKECDATFKSGILFEGWSPTPYLHSVGGTYMEKAGQYNYIYGKLLSENSEIISSSLSWENRIDKKYTDRELYPPYNQYHFNTNKLNDFLVKVATEAGIQFFEDDINDVILKEDGHIGHIKGNNKNYSYDFYIDSTGFRRLLIGKLGAKWQSFGKYLKMKSAITFQTPDEENYNLWTLSKALDYGWMFRIPVWGRHGNGYIFDSDYINEEQAKQEIEKLLGFEVEIGKTFNFDPGALDKVWINNCVAIGLSGSFVEPLEASSIGTSIQQAFLLMHRLSNYDQKVIDSYNKSVSDILENIRDFLVLHYVTEKNNTLFWSDLQKLELPDSLSNNLELWKDKLPIKEDFSSLSNYILFKDENFISVLHGLGLYNQKSIKKEFNSLNSNIKVFAENRLAEEYNKQKISNTVSHKQLISLIREMS